MQLLQPNDYKKLIHEQGRNLSWVSRQLECSYSLLYKYLNEIKPMKRERIEKLHKILVG